MIILFVSYDCGYSYYPERKAETVEELQPRMDELNRDMLRWYLEKDGEQDLDHPCGIHAGILTFLDAANRKDATP